MEHFVILIAASLAVTACAKAPQEKQEDTTQAPTVVEEFTLSKKCSDGTDIYQIDGGNYAKWDGENSQWIKLSPGVTPDDYCS